MNISKDTFRLSVVHFRIICAIIIAGISFFKLFFPYPSSVNTIPLEQTGIIVVFSLCLISSFVSTYIQQHVAAVMYALSFVCTAWLIRFTALSHYEFSQMVMITIMPLLFGLLIQTIRRLISYMIFYILCILAVLVTIPPQTFSVPDFIAILIGITIFFFFTIRSRILLLQALSENQTTLETVFTESADALIVVDALTWIPVLTNSRAREIFSVLKTLPADLTYLEQFHPPIVEMDRQTIGTVITTTSLWKQEHQITSTEHTKLWSEIIIKPITIQSKNHLLIRIADITHQKKIEETLRSQQKELSEMNKYMIGRELRMTELKTELDRLKTEKNS